MARAERLLAGRGMPLLFRGAAQPVLRWLATLPTAVLEAHPALWVTYASALLFIQQVAGVEEKLRAAEAALLHDAPDANVCDLLGHIAVIWATVAVTQHDAPTIMAQAQRALAYLHPGNLPVRAATTWALGYAAGAAALLPPIAPQLHKPHFVLQRPEFTAVQLLLFLRQGNLAAAALAQSHDLPLCRARVALAQGDPAAALATLTAYRRQAEASGWPDEQLRALILQALAQQALGEGETAVAVLSAALALAAPDGLIRPFVDEGAPLARLLALVAARGVMPDYARAAGGPGSGEVAGRRATSVAAV